MSIRTVATKPSLLELSQVVFDKETGVIFDYIGSDKSIVIPEKLDGVAVTSMVLSQIANVDVSPFSNYLF